VWRTATSVVVRDRKLDTQQLFSAVADAAALPLVGPYRPPARHHLVSVSADDTFVTVVIEENPDPDRHQPADADGRRRRISSCGNGR